VQQGEVCRYEFFIVSGTTRTFYLDESGQEHIIMFSIEEWWTSDMGSFITQAPADYHIQCLENTQIIQFSRELKEELYLEIPKLERFFRKIVERALVSSQKRLVRN
jgi:CRP-like cAMP-binding protein